MQLDRFQVLVMSGLPGSGKSRLAHELVEKFGRAKDLAEAYYRGDPSIIVSADDYYIGKDGVYRYIADEIGLAHKQCKDKFEYALDSGVPLVIVDNTNLRASDADFYFEMARKKGYSARMIRVNCDPADAFMRQRHNVPESVFTKMVSQWEKRDVRPEWEVEDYNA